LLPPFYPCCHPRSSFPPISYSLSVSSSVS
jgi:hypothetical protein